MTKMRTQYLGNLRTEIEHIQSGNKIITDAPLDNNGKGEFFSPTDMFSSSLGSCMLTIIGIAANTHGFSIDGTTLEIEKVMAANPRRVAEIKIDVHFPKGANYTDKQKRIIEAAAKTCPVANSLHPDVIKNITYIYE
ncbi:MAG: OsmC family protein [Bacteroidales bacterium]|nr:OsmC family protein [Bacteroidales bacterium]